MSSCLTSRGHAQHASLRQSYSLRWSGYHRAEPVRAGAMLAKSSCLLHVCLCGGSRGAHSCVLRDEEFVAQRCGQGDCKRAMTDRDKGYVESWLPIGLLRSSHEQYISSLLLSYRLLHLCISYKTLLRVKIHSSIQQTSTHARCFTTIQVLILRRRYGLRQCRCRRPGRRVRATPTSAHSRSSSKQWWAP